MSKNWDVDLFEHSFVSSAAICLELTVLVYVELSVMALMTECGIND